MSSKIPSGKRHGLSTWEKAGIPIIILIVAWVIYSATQPTVNIQPQTTSTSATISGGSYAPDFTLPVVGPNGPTGESLSLSSLRGKAVLLEFMEPWCPHCQSVAPMLNQLHVNYPNVTFVSVAGPWNGATENDVAQFERNYGSNWVFLYDSSGSIMNMYGVNATPTFIIITRSGSVAASLQGDQSYVTLANILIQSTR